ncbi:hypothetical protein Nepgr_033914 [Nepenthes gracilis]|uniref:Uncharacterized protein n=1 Tax=Nepenthes gracilis TaxID=150966 RepID=A0AAD3Y8Q4_NEPGR|nr:hypothetical protein Nepgr_033914 [Nepenthes gracilis]
MRGESQWSRMLEEIFRRQHGELEIGGHCLGGFSPFQLPQCHCGDRCQGQAMQCKPGAIVIEAHPEGSVVKYHRAYC